MSTKDIISKLTNEQITSIMLDLGSLPPLLDSNRSKLIFSTICHHHTAQGAKHKLYCYCNEDGHSFYCYTECGQIGNIFNVVMKIKNVGFSEAMNYICRKLGIYTKVISKGYGSSYLVDDWDILNSYKVYEKTIPNVPLVNEQYLNIFDKDYHMSWYEDNMSVEAMKKFGIRFYYPQDAIIIPHRNINGELIGIRKRNLDEDMVAKGFKYMPLILQGIMFNHPLQYNLYGLFENLSTIKRMKKIVIYESEKAVIQTETYFPNANFSVAVCGSNVSNYQRDLIVGLGVEEVILCFDRQFESMDSEEYQRHHTKMQKIANKFTPYVNTYIVEKGEMELLKYKDSPSDISKEVLIELMKNKEYIYTIEEEIA